MIESHHPSQLINSTVFQGFGFGRAILYDPGGGNTSHLNTMRMRVDQDTLCFQSVHECLLEVSALAVVLWDIQSSGLWFSVLLESQVGIVLP